MSDLRSRTPAIDIYIKLAQYPILADQIRMRMREELFRRGIVNPGDFEREVKEKAIESQRVEGFGSAVQEETSVWEQRLDRIRDYQTDAAFANNLGSALLQQIITEVLQNQSAPMTGDEINFNPEIAPWELLFRQGEIYESLPAPELKKMRHHLEEIKVVLIKRMLSDHLPYIGVAKNVLTIGDLRYVYKRRIGGGKIGGKAAGMLLAWKILQHQAPTFGPDISTQIHMPDSYFIGSEVIYEFTILNQLDKFMNQKYLPIEEIRTRFPNIEAAYLAGEMPDYVVERLRTWMEHKIGATPLAVRSSSLLEGNFAYSFAGKYGSLFLPNQASAEANLDALLSAIKRLFASTLNPDALLYRKHHNLLDYDERMSVILQKMDGHRYKNYFLPAASGVGYSQNPLHWLPELRREDGFMRLVWGLGTRAVGRDADDFPRLVALSHPTMQRDESPTAVRQYSQKRVDVLDLAANRHTTLPVDGVLEGDYPYLPLIASRDAGDQIEFIPAGRTPQPDDRYIITFEALLRDSRFIRLVRNSLLRLEHVYKLPVDVEFTVRMQPGISGPAYHLTILQCHPLSQRATSAEVAMPTDLPPSEVLFSTHALVPDGKVDNIQTILFVDPKAYANVSAETAQRVAQAIGQLNVQLQDSNFVLMGPGHWGSSNPRHGVPVSYGDIFATRVLIEMDSHALSPAPELAYGTYFLKDLVEADIYLLTLNTADDKSDIAWRFLHEQPNLLTEMLPNSAEIASILRVIDVTHDDPERRLSIWMNGRDNLALGFFRAHQPELEDETS